MTFTGDLLDAVRGEYCCQAPTRFHQLPWALTAEQEKDGDFDLAEPVLNGGDIEIVLGLKFAWKRMYVSKARGPCFLTTYRTKLVGIDSENVSIEELPRQPVGLPCR